VMMENMRHYWAAGDRANAQECAKDCAPYCHPRLTSIDGRIDNRVTIAVEDPLEALYLEATRRLPAGGEEADAEKPNGRTAH
jgi:hypothetical protein